MADFRDLDGVEFEIVRRGYDREKVDAYLAELGAEIARLNQALAGDAGDGAFPEPVQAELDRVSVEVDAIIGAARNAAEGLRTRAAAEASRWREEADADARRWRSEAEEESTRLHREAEAAARKLQDEAEADAGRRRTEADGYAARVREEADAYAQQTRQAAESAASQAKEEADAYAVDTRAAAEAESAEVREQADAYAARVTRAADAYADETRRAADDYAQGARQTADAEALQTRQAADGYAEETRRAADAEASGAREAAESDSARLRAEADGYDAEVRSTAAREAERMVSEAEQAAAAARKSAQDYAAALREGADTETARQRAEAREAAETARASVWEQSTAILENVAREAATVRSQAETEALAIIADGERQSHRMVTQARQSSEEQRRAARMEAERLVGDAQAQHDEIIEAANRAAAAAQERAQALERRRAELMGQLEKTQEAMRTLEEELEVKRGSLRERDVPTDSSTVKIVTAGEPEERAGVRVIPPGTRAVPAPVSAEEIMDEVRTLRRQREQVADVAAGPAFDVTGEREGAPGPPAEETAAEPELVEPKAPVRDIDSLFANLRQTGPAEEPASSSARRRPDPAVDPDELRERLLLPLQNRANREIKRQLTEQQNVALEQLRIAGGEWQPDRPQHERAFTPAITELVVESARAGYLAASELGVRSEGPPDLGPGDVDLPAEPFTADLVAAVSEALEASRSAGEAARKTSGSVSRVYRTWRTDRAEHRLREMSDTAYADALRLALRAEGVDDTEWALGEWVNARHAS